MINSNELMHGNWLFFRNQVNAFAFRVENVTRKKVGYHAEPGESRMHYLRLCECHPIPLDTRQLEKNGWKLNGEDAKFAPGTWTGNGLMLKQEPDGDGFRKARIVSSTDGSNGYMADELRRLRSRLNRDYAFLVLPIGYSLLLAVLTALSPAFHLTTTIASVFLMAFLTMLIVSDIKDLRRKYRRLADSIDGDRQERCNMLGAAMMGMLSQMAHRDRDDDDDE